jgi:hypothetical protein
LVGFGSAAGDRDLSTGLRQAQGERLAKALVATGDQSSFALETES